MIDLHNHILPNRDDGAVSRAVSLEMARIAVSSGVTEIAATPHCNSRRGGDNFLTSDLLSSLDLFRADLKGAGIPLAIHSGAEIQVDSRFSSLLYSGVLPTLCGSRYLLIEFSFEASAPTMRKAFDAVFSAGYVPIVAHPERYDLVCYDPQITEDWFSNGVVLQLNKGSFSGIFGDAAAMAAHWIVRHGFAHLVASDAHGLTARNPDFTRIHAYLKDLCGEDYAKILLEGNPRRIVEDRELIPANGLPES